MGDRTELQHIDPPSPSGHRCVSFLFSWAVQPGAWGPSLSGTCSHSSIFSPTGLVSKLTGWWPQRPLLLGGGFLYHILSPASGLQKLTDFLSSPSYITVQSPTQSLEWHVMQFTGHSLPVHQSMSVPWDFTLSHIVSQAHLHNFFS